MEHEPSAEFLRLLDQQDLDPVPRKVTSATEKLNTYAVVFEAWPPELTNQENLEVFKNLGLFPTPNVETVRRRGKVTVVAWYDNFDSADRLRTATLGKFLGPTAMQPSQVRSTIGRPVV